MLLPILPLVATASAAGGFDAHGFHLVAPEADLRAPLSVSRYSLGAPLGLSVTGLFEYAKSPLVEFSEVDGVVTRTAVLDDVIALNLSAGFSPWRWLRIDAGLPLFLSSTDRTGSPQGFVAGDGRLAALFTVLRPDAEAAVGLGLAVRPHIDVPLGASTMWLGQDGVAGGGVVAGSVDVKQLSLSADVGVQFQPTSTLGNLDNADQVLIGAAVGYLVTDHFGATLESRTRVPMARNAVAGTQTPSELILSARYRHDAGAHAIAGVAAGLTDGAGSATWRIFLGGGVGAVLEAKPPPDTDGDGLTDDQDGCPTEAEVLNTYLDRDGCPDKLGRISATAIDPVGSTVVDAQMELIDEPGAVRRVAVGSLSWPDALPQSRWKVEAQARCLAGEAEVATVQGNNAVVVKLTPARGAEVAVRAVDGAGRPVPNAVVQWGEAVGYCADASTALASGSGSIPVGAGRHEIFVSAPGLTTWQQTVDVPERGQVEVVAKLGKSRVRLTETQVVILDRVYFETGKATIKAESLALLDEVAQTIRRARLQKVEVAGHTDDVGADAANLTLSTARAESVRDYLTK